MTSSSAKNQIVIELASECLRLSRSGFANVTINQKQGTFPDVYGSASDLNNNIHYLIGITGRSERKVNGDWDDRFNLVRNDRDHERAKELVSKLKKEPAFVAIAFREADYSYTAYFGELNLIGFPRAIPMLPNDRSNYRQLIPYTKDKRVERYFS